MAVNISQVGNVLLIPSVTYLVGRARFMQRKASLTSLTRGPWYSIQVAQECRVTQVPVEVQVTGWLDE